MTVLDRTFPPHALLAAVFLCCSDGAASTEPPRPAENVLVVTLDGLRWQEVFGGADESYIDQNLGGVRDVPALKDRYLRDSAAERRETLLPFFWGTVAKQGQVFGNRAFGASARCTNGLKFSYPGYSELFCGFADPEVDSNAKRENPNPNVFEFLAGRPGFENRVEAACTWDVIPFVLRSHRNGLPVHAGWEPLTGADLTVRERTANEMLDRLPHYWPDNAFDAFALAAAESAYERRSPRVFYLALGETDEWGHGRRYDLYLDAACNADRFLAAFWSRLQNDPRYAGKTALLITTDHGRGSTREDWTDHGKGIEGAEYIWVAVMGPNVPSLGERENVEVTQSQVAATVAALVGEDFRDANPAAVRALPVFRGD